MRISAERQNARIRVSKVKVAIHEAMEKIDPKTTDAEINMALLELLSDRQNYVLMAETPIPQ